MKKKVAVGLSGGIDSSYAAYILKKQGFDVVGFTLKLTPQENRCCNLEGLHHAQRLCQKLGIPHYTLDVTEYFSKEIIGYFTDTYLLGATPNPCALCNRLIKFGIFFEKVKALGIEYLATGHYARLVRYQGQVVLARAKDNKKSQEYFLSMVEPRRLPHLVFPLGNLTKEEVKKESVKKNLIFEARKESQDICFIEKDPYPKFIEQRVPGAKNCQGPIVHVNGTRLGDHPGVYYFTYGQREGLRVSWREPLYVINIDAASNTVVVGERKYLRTQEFLVACPNWFIKSEILQRTIENVKNKFFVKVRYNAPLHLCRLRLLKDSISVLLEESIEAVTPGQIAAFYQKDRVIGAGIIQKRQLLC